jgi:hypothetical protein
MGTFQAGRIFRLRHGGLVGAADRLALGVGSGAPGRLVQVYDGGSMPSSNDHFYLTYPVELDGAETEGGAGTPVADTTQTIPVVVIGSLVPSVGDLLTAYAVGGRWVAERYGTGSGSVSCSPCAIPRRDLTLSYVNVIYGNDSAPLAYTAAPASWTSACKNGLLYELLCTGGVIELRVIYFTVGSCPSGTQQYCSNLRASPFGLTVSAYSCTPFSITFRSQSSTCPTITNAGYTQFTVTL